MNKIAPNWVLWISLISLILFGIDGLFNIILTLKNISEYPATSLGAIIGIVILIYFVVYIPVNIVYKYLKEDKK